MQHLDRAENVGDVGAVVTDEAPSGSPVNGRLHNPGRNKGIIPTDMSLNAEIIVFNCLIWDFQPLQE